MDARQHREAEEKQSPSAKVVHRAILMEGREELARSSSALFWSGVAAGLAMGFSLVAEGLLRAHLPESQWAPLVSKFGYTVGFLFVTLGRQQLFTETTVIAVIPVLHDRNRRQLSNLLRFWAVVFAANILGAAVFAAIATKTAMFSPEARAAFSAIGHETLAHSFGDALLKGVFGGWLVALMVWLLPASESARFWTIIVATWLLAISKLTHVIAGSVEGLYSVFSGEAALSAFVLRFLVPVLIGNTLGGVLFVSVLNHAQVAHGEE